MSPRGLYPAGLTSPVASPSLSRHRPRSPLAPQLLGTGGKGGKAFLQPHSPRESRRLLVGPCSRQGLLYIGFAPLCWMLVLPKSCQLGSSANKKVPPFPFTGMREIPPTPRLRTPRTGSGAGRDELAKQHHFHPEEEANALCPRL